MGGGIKCPVELAVPLSWRPLTLARGSKPSGTLSVSSLANVSIRKINVGKGFLRDGHNGLPYALRYAAILLILIGFTRRRAGFIVSSDAEMWFLRNGLKWRAVAQLLPA